MSVEIVMTRESFDCLEKLVPEGLAERMGGTAGLPPRVWHGASPGRAQLHPRGRGRVARARAAELRAGG